MAFTLCIIYALFGPRPVDFDETSLFHPAYAFSKENVVTAKIWARDDGSLHVHPYLSYAFWMHPPVYYMLVGTALKFLPAYYAEAVVPMILIMFCLYFAYTIKAPSQLKYAYVLATFTLVTISVTLLQNNFGARPDMAGPIAWLAGILAMEKARHDNWNPVALALGSMLIVLGFTFHYINAFIIFGLLVYAVVAYRELDRGKFARAFFAAAFGTCLVGIPYLVYFMIPLSDHIYTWLTQAGETNLHGHDPIAIMLFKLGIQTRWDFSWSSVGLFKVFPGMLHSNYVPIGLVSSLGLLIFRNTRVFGLAVLPQMLFAYFIADKVQHFYMILEYMLMAVLLSVAVMRAINWLLNKARLSIFEALLNFVLAAGLMIYFVNTSTNYKQAFREIGGFQYHWMDVARAASQNIVGPGAIVGDYGAVWYISGGEYWFPIHYRRLYEEPEYLDEYLDKASSFAVYNLRNLAQITSYRKSHWAEERDGELASLYAQNKIFLGGIVHVPGAMVIQYVRKMDKPFSYYLINTGAQTVEKLQKVSNHDSVIGTYLCVDFDKQPKRGFFKELTYYPTFMKIDGSNPQILGIFRTSSKQFLKMTNSLPDGCQIKEAHLGRILHQPWNDFMTEVPYFTSDMTFHRSLDDAVRAKEQP